MPRFPGFAAFVGALSTAVPLCVSPASAGGLAMDLANPRAIGRAGTDAVSGDSGSAVLFNPAGQARREDTRLVLSTGILDTDSTFRAANAGDRPTISDATASRVAPLLGFHRKIGPVMFGATFMTTADISRHLPEPLTNQTADDVDRLFPHRYGGTQLTYNQKTIALGAAMRATDWLGVGVAAAVSRAEMTERRHIWAGFAGRDPVGYPSRDLVLSLEGSDSAVPSASAGALIAPPQIPFEMAVSFVWSGVAHLSGGSELRRTHSDPYPEPSLETGEATISVSQPLLLRTGIRYLGERTFVELGADMYWARGHEQRTWKISDVTVTDETGVVAPLASAPALLHLKTHKTLRAAVDYELVGEFVWITGGYAWQSAASPHRFFNPAYSDPGGHTVGLGAEFYFEDVAITFGYARRIKRTVTVAAEHTAIDSINPFDAGSVPAGAGRHRSTSDLVGLSVEKSWY